MTVIEKVRAAAGKDPSILCDKRATEETLGSNPLYLEEVLGITKSDLLRLERKGLALKARYETKKGHRVRWLIFKEVLE